MLTLLIETSTEKGLIAILDGAEVLYKVPLSLGIQSSRNLIPCLAEGMNSLNLTPKDFACIGVGKGPGSYTGIRLGVIVAKTMSFALKVPLVGICSLHCFTPAHDTSFAALIDAKIGGVYFVKGMRSGETISYSTLPQVCELDKLGELLHDVEVLLTPNSTVLRPKIENLWPGKVWEWVEVFPDASQMGSITRREYEEGRAARDSRVEIMYLRKTQAEIERDRVKS